MIKSEDVKTFEDAKEHYKQDKQRMIRKVAEAIGLTPEDLEGESILQIALTYNQIVYNEAMQREQQRQQMNRQKQAAIKQSGILVDPYGKKR